jgi:hypothetical protein
MLKKMMLLAISVGALVAFAAPAVAQAQELYELEGKVHKPLAVGVEVTATSTNLITHTPLGTLECTKVTIHGIVAKNETNTAHISNNSITVEGCNTTITDPTVGTITILANKTGLAHSATFEADLSPTLTCHYAGNIPFTYAHDTDVLTVDSTTEQFTGSPANPCGNGRMTGSFTLETSNGVAVFME